MLQKKRSSKVNSKEREMEGEVTNKDLEQYIPQVQSILEELDNRMDDLKGKCKYLKSTYRELQEMKPETASENEKDDIVEYLQVKK